MKNYNVVFDMSPLEDNKDYLQVGFELNAAEKLSNKFKEP